MFKRMSAFAPSIAVIFLAALVGCSTAGELVLDDTWRIAEIQTQNKTYTDVGEWITIAFDFNERSARVATGSAWPGILRGIDDTFTYEVAAADHKIYLKKNGEIRHRIDYELKPVSGEMRWVRWQASGITFVGEDSLIRQVVFTRK